MLTALIMAGGSGERFWPLSTPTKPKQLLSIFSNKSMIRETVDRILPIIEAKKIFIATNILQVEEIRKELYDIPEENIIIEPEFKDTAAAISYSSLVIKKILSKEVSKNEKIKIVVLASDHLIKKSEEFRSVLKLGAEVASKNGVIVTLGIKPTKPETGYGYIEVKTEDSVIINNIYKVKRFREKPNLEIAENYLATKKFLWNSGIFIFTIDTIFKNIEVLMEEHFEVLKGIEEKINKKINEKIFGLELAKLVEDDFIKFEKISIDFGIMEHSKNIRVIPVDIDWNDIGSFNAFDDIFEKNKSGNILKNCNVKELDSNENIIIGDGLNISLLGVNSLIVIKNGNNLLIANKNRAQDIKKIIIKEEG